MKLVKRQQRVSIQDARWADEDYACNDKGYVILVCIHINFFERRRVKTIVHLLRSSRQNDPIVQRNSPSSRSAFLSYQQLSKLFLTCRSPTVTSQKLVDHQRNIREVLIAISPTPTKNKVLAASIIHLWTLDNAF